MQQQEQTQPSSLDNLKAVSTWLGLLARSIATSVEVFLHSGFGHRYLGLQAFAALPIIIVFAGCCEGHNPMPLGLFFWAYIFACFRARVTTMRARSRGEVIHSLYTGRPWVTRWFPKKDELEIKAKVEPAMVLTVGILMLMVNPPLGLYLILASVCLAGTVGATLAYDRAKADQAIDSIIEARQHADRVRVMAGHRF